MAKEEHRLEKLIRLAKEKFDLNLELRLKSMMTESGRPAFMKKLTPQEQLSRYLDPESRQMVEQSLAPDELQNYYDKMTKLMQGGGLDNGATETNSTR